MKKQIFLVLALLFASAAVAQNVGIGTTAPDASAQLDVSSTDKGMLIPRMTSAQRMGIATPTKALMVFDNETNSFWFFDGTIWKPMKGEVGNAINFRYYASIAQGLNEGVNTKVNFDLPSFLNNADFSNSSFTVPADGIYNLNISLMIYGNSSGNLNLSFYVNNGYKTGGGFNIISSVFQQISFSDNVLLSAGDIVTVMAQSSSGYKSLASGAFFTGFKIN